MGRDGVAASEVATVGRSKEEEEAKTKIVYPLM
jgi:hypothetical protein